MLKIRLQFLLVYFVKKGIDLTNTGVFVESNDFPIPMVIISSSLKLSKMLIIAKDIQYNFLVFPSQKSFISAGSKLSNSHSAWAESKSLA